MQVRLLMLLWRPHWTLAMQLRPQWSLLPLPPVPLLPPPSAPLPARWLGLEALREAPLPAVLALVLVAEVDCSLPCSGRAAVVARGRAAGGAAAAAGVEGQAAGAVIHPAPRRHFCAHCRR